MLRITSINLNGIRSAFRKGLQPWMAAHAADILCLQEIKISESDLTDELRHPPGYTGHFLHAAKKGYSGVGIYLRDPAERVHTGLGCEEFDPEGRIIRADWKSLSVISAYLPSGSSGDERQQAKYRFLDRFGPWLDSLMDDVQLAASRVTELIDHPSEGRMLAIRPTTCWSGMALPDLAPAPRLGADTQAVLREAGFAESRIERLRRIRE